MNRRTFVHAAGALLVLLTAPRLGARAPQPPQPQNTIEPITVPLSDPGRPGTLEVRLIQGRIVVKGTNRRDVLVTGRSSDSALSAGGSRRRREAAAEAEAAGLRRLNQPGGFRVEEEANTVSVSAGLPRDLAIEIEVPTRFNLRLATVNGGDIEVSGVDGELELSNVNGNVTATGVSGSVIAHSVNGDIRATLVRVRADAPMAFTSLNGNVDVTLPSAVKATVRLRSDQGDVFTDFDLQMRRTATSSSPPVPPTPPTPPGSRRRDTDRDAARRDRERPRGNRIDVNRELTGTVNGGGADVELRTFNGDVYLRRSR